MSKKNKKAKPVENKKLKIILKIVRPLLSAAAFGVCLLPNSYKNPVLDPKTMATLRYESVNYFAKTIQDNGNWFPFACAILCALSVIMAIVCIFKETENTLTWLTGITALAMVANLLTAILFEMTAIGWGMTAILVVAVVIASYQEIQLEMKRMKMK